MLKKILFYDDSEDFGGHEVMALNYASALAHDGKYQVIFFYSNKNHKLKESLAQLCNSVAIHGIPYNISSRSTQGIRTLLSPFGLLKLTNTFKAIGPDVIIALQGCIEISTLGMVAAKFASIPLVSYIPLAHSMRVFGAKFAKTRDLIYKFYYRLPDLFIAISHDQKQKIIDNGVCPERIVVVNNFISGCNNETYEKDYARCQLDLTTNNFLIGLLGRIDFKQKCQDVFVRSIASNRESLVGFHFAIMGSGPDYKLLSELVTSLELEDVVTLIPWSTMTGLFYSALDAVIIPSSFEGVPLVMLEAVHNGLPVIASNVDGMAEFLPREWLFAPGNDKAMVDAILNLNIEKTCSILRDVQMRFKNCFDPQKSTREFILAIDSVVNNSVRETVLNNA